MNLLDYTILILPVLSGDSVTHYELTVSRDGRQLAKDTCTTARQVLTKVTEIISLRELGF